MQTVLGGDEIMVASPRHRSLPGRRVLVRSSFRSSSTTNSHVVMVWLVRSEVMK